MPEMNKLLEARRPDIMWWEYLRWLGIWILLSTTDGHPRRDLWKIPPKKEDVSFNGAPFRFNDIMSYRRFQEILSVHRTYHTEYPPYKDRFHPVRDFLNAWNNSMVKKLYTIMDHLYGRVNVEVDQHVELPRIRFLSAEALATRK